MEQEARRAAVERAYRDHADDVYRVAFGILRDRDTAADLTHDAFARAFERWDQYDATRPVVAWLHGIVTHLALDSLRRHRIRSLFRAPSLDASSRVRAIDMADPRAPDPAGIAAYRSVVDQALDGLPPRARAALVLRHYHGYDYAEIGGFLGTSAGNVGSILTRSHAAIRARLAAEPPASRDARLVESGRSGR